MPIIFEYRHYRIQSHLPQGRARVLVDSILDRTVVYDKVYRDNWRTLSARIRFDDDMLMLKVPRARNRRRWERFLTVFRGSDAARSFWHLERMASMGFSAPRPMLVAEKREAGVVTDSLTCYRYVEGRPAGPDDAPRILDELRVLHARGYLRSDAQIANFLISGEAVVFIDFRLKRPLCFSSLQKAREIDRFVRSCPEAEASLKEKETSSVWYRVAQKLENMAFSLRNLKKRFRKRRK